MLGQFATANDNVSVPINQVFERLNKERVTTGLLSDYGVQLIDIAYHLIRKKSMDKNNLISLTLSPEEEARLNSCIGKLETLLASKFVSPFLKNLPQK